MLELFAIDRDVAVAEFVEFHGKVEDLNHSLSEKPKKTKATILKETREVLGEVELSDVCSLPKQDRDALLASLTRQGLSIRQIERMTGVSRGIVARA